MYVLSFKFRSSCSDSHYIFLDKVHLSVFSLTQGELDLWKKLALAQKIKF